MKDGIVSDAFFRIHSGLEREGPGSAGSTIRALELVDPARRDSPHVLDLGCGPGSQTMTLAQALPDAHITAVDTHEPFIEEVRRRAQARGVDDRVSAVVADMADLSAVVDRPVDLIWAEGSAYSIGFRDALATWREFLVPGGFAALSEPVWAAPSVPQRVSDFWTAAYPGMQPVQVLRAQILHAGFQRIGDFALSVADWDAYYGPLRERVEELRGANGMSQAISAHDEELAVYDSGGPAAVGYQFFVMRRVS